MIVAIGGKILIVHQVLLLPGMSEHVPEEGEMLLKEPT